MIPYNRTAESEAQTYLENKKYWEWYNENQAELIDIFDAHDIDFSEFEDLLKHNFASNGSASISLLDEDGGLLRELIDGADVWAEIERIIHAMGVAQNRHQNTDYDSIDKSGMTDEQVSQLRKMYNK